MFDCILSNIVITKHRFVFTVGVMCSWYLICLAVLKIQVGQLLLVKCTVNIDIVVFEGAVGGYMCTKKWHLAGSFGTVPIQLLWYSNQLDCLGIEHGNNLAEATS